MSVTAPLVLTTRSGIELEVRQAREADEADLKAFFDRVTEQDRRFRFLAAADHVTHEQLEPLVHTDHFRSESWIGFNRASGQIVVSGLLACDGPLDTCEVAISVCGDHKGKGIGWAMLQFLSQQAQSRGCRRVISIESRNNHAAIEVEREHGFVPEPVEGDPSLVVLSRICR
jgi:Acetyltransferases